MSIFVKLVCEALTDAKILAAGPGAFWIYSRGLLYAKQHLTDGVVPDDAMPLVAFGIVDIQTEVSKLITLKLWEKCDGGHRVPEHIWLKYNNPADQIKELSEKRREAGRRGGRPKVAAKSNLQSEESYLLSTESKSANSPKPRVQSSEFRAQSSEHRSQTRTKSADAESVSEDPQTLIDPGTSPIGAFEPPGGPHTGTPDDPSTTTHVKPTRHAYTRDFERWYAIYPVKAGKFKAAAAFGRALKRISHDKHLDRDEALDWLCSVTATFAASPKGTSGQYAGYPEGWLNGGHYDDDPSEWNRSGNGVRSGPSRDSINGLFS